MSQKTQAWIYLILLSFIWGSSFILMKRGMVALDGTPLFSSLQVGVLRIVIAGIILLPLIIFNIKKIQHKKDWLLFAVVGYFGNFFPSLLFTYAEEGLSSGLTAIIDSLTPVFTVLIGVYFFRQQIKFIQIAGLLVAFIGVYLLILFGNNVSFSGNLPHIIAVVLATLCYGISVNTIKFKLMNYSPMEIASLSFATSLIPAVLIALFAGTYQVIQTNSKALEGLFFISILSIIGTAVALFFFNKLIAISSTIFSSSVTYSIPIVAVFIGAQFGETIHYLQIIAMIIILSGIYLVNKKG
jgi:drug/metabolite transporter (DMT)-like permease